MYILISPKLTISNKFYAMAINLVFKEWLGLIIINKAYLVLQ